MTEVNKVCASCGQTIKIDINNICGIAKLQTKYYHPECLMDLARKRMQKNKHAACWDYAVEHLEACKKDARDTISYSYWRDRLNEHLLRHYDVVAFPNSFWNIIADLTNGEFRHKKCRPVSMETLASAWAWSQRRLDEINRRNKMQHKGPKTDLERANYDLSIVVGHIGDYEKAKAKEKAAEAERELKAKENINIDYSKVQVKKENSGLGDISDLIDDLI